MPSLHSASAGEHGEAAHCDLLPGTDVLRDTWGDAPQKGPVLVPRPSNDPNDPLTWSRTWKYLIVGSQFLYLFVSVESALSMGPMFPFFAKEFGLDDTQLSLFTGTCVLALGFANFIIVPCSNIFGRRVTSISLCLLGAATCIWQALATSYSSMLAARAINGIATATSETILVQVVSDVFFLHDRGLWTGVYFMGYFLGLFIGPIIAGNIAQRFGWRSFFWLSLAMTGVNLIMLAVFVPETKYSRPTDDPASSPPQVSSSNDPKPESIQLEHIDPDPVMVGRGRPSKAKFKLWQSPDPNWKQLLVRDTFSCITLFFFPIILWAGLNVAGPANVLLYWNLTESAILSAPPNNFSPSAVGYSNFAFVVGGSLGLLTAGPFSDWIAMRATTANNGIREAEMRLPALIPYFVTSVIGIVVGGVGYAREWDWPVLIVVGYGFTGLCVTAVPTIAVAYAVDCYRSIAGEIMVVATVIKNSCGFAMSYWVFPLAARRGWLTPAMVQLALTAGPMVLGLPMVGPFPTGSGNPGDSKTLLPRPSALRPRKPPAKSTRHRGDSLLRHARRHQPDAIRPPPGTELERTSLDAASPNDSTTNLAVGVAQRSIRVLPGGEQPPTDAASLLTPLAVHDNSATVGPLATDDFTRPGAAGWFPTGIRSVQGPGPASATTDHGQDIDLDLSSHAPEWFAGNDFDLDAFNTTIMSTAYFYPQTSFLPNHEESVSDDPRPSEDDLPIPVEDLIQQNWFILIQGSCSGSITPDTARDQSYVDEEYREHLATKLQHHLPILPLPSTDFLVGASADLHFQCINIHEEPLCTNVLYSISSRLSHSTCSKLSSVRQPLPPAAIDMLHRQSILKLPHRRFSWNKNIRDFEQVHSFKCMAPSDSGVPLLMVEQWERCISTGGYEALTMVQAALLGQTFGMLSRRRKDLLTAQTFHGTVIAWARRFNMFQAGSASKHLSPDLLAREPEKAWKTWIHAEERNRIAAGLYIHDIELAQLSFSDPFLGSGLSKLPPISDENLWAAPTAEAWATALTGPLSNLTNGSTYSPLEAPAHIPSAPGTPNNRLYAYLELQRMAVSIIQGRSSGDFSQRQHHRQQQHQQQQHTTSLITFYNTYILTPHRRKPPPADPYLLPALWHSLFISLSTDLNRLELVIGREGHHEAQRHTDYAHAWARSPDGLRSALHASMILHELEAASLAAELPIHAPRILFRAAIAWFCYTKYGAPGSGDANADANSDANVQRTGSSSPSTMPALHRQFGQFPEFHILPVAPPQVLYEVTGLRSFRPNTPETGTFRRFVDVLQRVGHWGVSRNYAYLLSLLFPEGGGGGGGGRGMW
ncbi:uncharacterized MFS-type transporter C1271.10c [Aspergillus udagawae]|uniref:Uncharacterized MFS-type transporter C1271.10c n=1 Tax=Aspergillus udagawae TaxID=91492 RepID=A0ABQ1BFW5_9EURO|nr:uncharacterized MFS-type transporter C1271.10c [Aspergillus udagawae]